MKMKSPSEFFLYHGTTEESLARIKEEGLRTSECPRSYPECELGIYLTTRLPDALLFAQHASEQLSRRLNERHKWQANDSHHREIPSAGEVVLRTRLHDIPRCVIHGDKNIDDAAVLLSPCNVPTKGMQVCKTGSCETEDEWDWL